MALLSQHAHGAVRRSSATSTGDEAVFFEVNDCPAPLGGALEASMQDAKTDLWVVGGGTRAR
jgi:hypothetical protein